MNTDKIQLLRFFIESLEANDSIFKQSVLEALDALIDMPILESEESVQTDEQAMQEAAMDNRGRRLDEFGIPKLSHEIQWASMQTELKDFVGDATADDMLVILRNNTGGTHLVFKKDGKVEFVTNVPEMKDLEPSQSSIPINVPRREETEDKSKFLSEKAINKLLH